jgi:hypothetical protein
MPHSAARAARAALVLAAILAPALAAAPLGAQPKPQRVDAGSPVTPDASIRLAGGVASLRVIGWDRDSVALTGTVPAGTRVDGTFGPQKTPVRGAKMFVELPKATSGGALELRVPARARLWVKLGIADVVVTGVTGALDLNVVGGSIAVTGSPRELRAEAMDGTVTVDGAPEWLRVKTASGDVVLRGGDSTASDVGLATVSGMVHVSGGRYERVRLESVTGAITFGGALARGAALDVETHSGEVILALRGASAEVDIATLTGTVMNKLTAARPIAGREGRGQELGLTIGGGSARVVVRSFKGAVRLVPDAGAPPDVRRPR